MREVEIVEHLQIDGLRVFFDTVQYRTPHVHRELELIWLSDGDLECAHRAHPAAGPSR